MSRHSIELPPDLEAKAAARAAESGCASIEEYLESLVRADAEGEDFGAPDHLTVKDDRELEALLQDRLKDDRESIDAAPEFWEELHRDLRTRNKRRPESAQ
jgi:hypothetical protein